MLVVQHKGDRGRIAIMARFLTFAAVVVAGPAHSQTIGNASNGATLYAATGQNCVNCHSSPPSTSDGNKVFNGVDWTRIRAAVSGGVSDMSKFASLSDSQLKDLSAWICKSINSTASTCNAPAPTISATPTSLAFGNQTVATSGTAKTVTVKNTGSAALLIGAISLADTTNFGLSHNCPSSLPATSGTCTVTVNFKPQAVASYASSVQISHNDATKANPLVIALSGTGTPAPAPVYALSSSALSFSATVVGLRSATQTLTISNSGNANLLLSSPAAILSGTNASDFTITANTCSGTTLSPSGANSCTVTLSYSPQSSGSSKVATLTIANGSGIPAATVNLSGGAATNPAPLLQANPNTIAFGAQYTSSSTTRTFTLLNSGTADATGLTISVNGGAAFGATSTCGPALVAGGNCVVTVSFSPSALAAYADTVTVASSAPSVTVSLSGTGVTPAANQPTIALTPSALVFPSQQQNTSSAPQTVTLQNTGTADLPVTGLLIGGLYGADFAVAAGAPCGAVPFTLQVNQSCTLAVVYTPMATGASAAQLTVVSGVPAAGNPVVSLAGTAVAPPQAVPSLSTGQLFFPPVAAGSTTAGFPISVANTGNAALTGSATITGLGASQFAIVSGTNACPVPLFVAAGGSCIVYVVFSPSIAGAASATLSLSTNAGAYQVALSGTGGVSSAPAPNLSGSGAWPTVLVGASGGTQTFVLSNDGNASMSLGLPSITGSAAADFGIAQSTCGAMLAPQQICSIVVGFTPNDVGARNAALQVQAAGVNLTVALSGTGSAVAVHTSSGLPPGAAIGPGAQSGSGGGCTVGDPSRGLDDPILIAMAMLALLALTVRRRPREDAGGT